MKYNKRYSRTRKPSGKRKRTKNIKGTKVTYWPSTRKSKKWMTITPKGKKVHWGHPTMKEVTNRN